ncbi:MAG: hypothetical protein FWG38_06580 [Defluviitaleaceae bacterium]|nr:hypothetical protein [Defluviitaleaceae bacterium]
MYQWDKKHRPDITNDYDGTDTERTTFAERLIERYGAGRVFKVFYGVAALLLVAQTAALFILRRELIPASVFALFLVIGLLILLVAIVMFVYPQAFFFTNIMAFAQDRHGNPAPIAIAFRRMGALIGIVSLYIVYLIGAFALSW